MPLILSWPPFSHVFLHGLGCSRSTCYTASDGKSFGYNRVYAFGLAVRLLGGERADRLLRLAKRFPPLTLVK